MRRTYMTDTGSSTSHAASCFSGRASAILLALALVLAASGCGALRTHIAREDQAHFRGVTVRGVQRTTYRVTEPILKGAGIQGSFVAGNIEVAYTDRSQAWLATGLAREMALVLAAVEKRIGVTPQYKLVIYLVATDEQPQTAVFSLASKERAIKVPIFAARGTQSLGDLLRKNQFPIFATIHEFTEASLVSPAQGSPVLLDGGVWPIRASNRTRWFREGIANYAGFIATEAIRADLGVDMSAPVFISFSRLAEAGPDLFSWTQMQSTAKDYYYDASFTLFYMIRYRYGEDSIRGIVEGKDSIRYVDGKALIALADKILGADIVKMVLDLRRLPDVGLGLSVSTGSSAPWLAAARTNIAVGMVEEGSLAAKAGLKPGDLIVSLNGSPLTSYTQTADAFLAALDKGSADFVILRDSVVKTVSFKLEKTARPRPTPSGRKGASTPSMLSFFTEMQTVPRVVAPTAEFGGDARP